MSGPITKLIVFVTITFYDSTLVVMFILYGYWTKAHPSSREQ